MRLKNIVIDLPILTSMGYKQAKDLKFNDKIVTSLSKEVKIDSISSGKSIKVYKVIFSDGTSTECCIDCLWQTQIRSERRRKNEGRIRSLQTIIDTLNTKNGISNHYIPIIKQMDFKRRLFSIEPYVLGCFLGDGTIVKYPAISSGEESILKCISEEMNRLNCKLSKKSKYDYNIVRKDTNSADLSIFVARNVKTDKEIVLNSFQLKSFGYDKKVINNHIRKGNKAYKNMIWQRLKLGKGNGENYFKKALENLKLLGTKSGTKFVPEIYKYGSVKQRIALLQGLLDTDGTIDKRYSSISFASTSINLINDVRFIVESLGGICRKTTNKIGKYKDKNGKIIICKVCYQVTILLPNNIIPFRTKNKLNRYKPKTKYFPYRNIKSIKEIGYKKTMNICTNATDYLYLTNNFITMYYRN